MRKRQKLELQWPHKDRRLLYEYGDDGKPQPLFADLCRPEPRVLLDLEQYGSEDGKAWDEKSNLLIRGDNLLALETLNRYYAGKVKLIYIDPPFNTGMAFAEYDDGLEHSTWLTLMRDRLELLWSLLAPDGSIWCEIDDTEVGYLNVLLDEQFGRDNRISTVTVKRSAGTGHKAINPGPINVTDYIFGYAKNRSQWTYNPLLMVRGEYDKAYNKFIPNVTEPHTQWRIDSLPDSFAGTKGFKDAKAGRKVMGAPAFRQAMEKFALENAQHVVRMALPDYDSVSAEAREYIDKSKNDTAIHHLAREDYSDMYFYKGDRILFLANKVSQGENGEPGLAEKLTNFWDDVPWQGIAKEGGVDFPKNKKPERLVQRIVSMTTRPGDLVLDSFAGSGTTGAVAHKMGRRWLMVELGEHAETLARPRLERVVAGQDASGVSKAEAFTGGGGFRYMALGEPLLAREPELGLEVLNPVYTNGMLVTAVCLREGFQPTDGAVLHGRGGERAFAHVTETFVTTDVLQTLGRDLPDGGSLTVFCLRHDAGLELPEGMAVRKVPADLASRYCDLLDAERA